MNRVSEEGSSFLVVVLDSGYSLYGTYLVI